VFLGIPSTLSSHIRELFDGCCVACKTLRKNRYKGFSSHRGIIRDPSFRWKKTKRKREVHTKRHDIRPVCIFFLTVLRKYKASGWPIIFQDGTDVYFSYIILKNWTNDSLFGLTLKCKRLIIFCVGERGLYFRCTSHI
jgi:hypothetical protein